MRDKILKILLDDINNSVSGEKISSMLGISRAAVWKHINKLKEMGADIKSATGGGYSLVSVPDWLNTEVFEYYDKDINVLIEDDVLSTNSLCMKLADENLADNTLVIASTQSKGKGRLARQWDSSSGGVWMSILLRPNLSPNAIPPITLLSAVAVCKALEEIFDGIAVFIKWPNDIHITNKKLCGILVEAATDIDGVRHVVAGIGVNANNSAKNFPDEIKSMATTLTDNNYLSTRAHIATTIRKHLIDLVQKYEISQNIDFIKDYYSHHLLWKGKMIMLKNMGLNKIEDTGVLIGINNAGNLIIDSNGVQKAIVSGELNLRKANLD